MSYPLLEICQNTIFIKICVVRTGSFYFLDVGLNDGVVITNRLHKEKFVAFLNNNSLIQQSSPFPGCVGCIKYCNLPVVINPLKHVGESHVTNLSSNLDSFWITVIKELVTWLVITLQLPPILPEVEHPGGDSDPVEVPGQLLADVRLPPGGETHHHDHVRGRGAARLYTRRSFAEGSYLRKQKKIQIVLSIRYLTCAGVAR